MAEVLTQSQIDELLSELAGGDGGAEALKADEKKIRQYNFRNPKKLARDQQKVLRGIGEVFARHLSSYLAGMTRTYCEVTVESLEEHPYKEYNNALPDIQLTGVLDVSTIKTAMLLDLSNSLSFALIERMFGGVVTEREVPVREFTDIEVALMERIIRRITALFQEAWTFLPDMEITVRQVETNTRFIKSIGMDDMVTTMVMAITLGPVHGTLTCCLPCMEMKPMLEAVIDEQSGMHRLDEDENERSREAMMTQVQNAQAEVCAILGTATVPMREVLDLQPGDVIRLDQGVDKPVLITVNGRNWFFAVPGMKKNKMALRINRPYAI